MIKIREQGKEKESMGELQNSARKLVGAIDMLITLIEVMVSQVYTYAKIFQIVYLKHMLFIAHQLCLIKMLDFLKYQY